MKVYHGFMDTDIDKFDFITTSNPEKDEDEWWWDVEMFEVESFYDLITRFDLDKWEAMEGIDEVFSKLAKEKTKEY